MPELFPGAIGANPVSTVGQTGSTDNINYSASGDTSSVFVHRQNAYLSYEQINISRPTGNWPPTSENAPKFRCVLSYTVNETIMDWATASSVSGAATGAASGSDVNSRLCGSATLYSFDSTQGLGTSGYVHFGNGISTRLATGADYEYIKGSNFEDILITTPIGLATSGIALQDDLLTAQAFVQQINTALRTGGMEYSTNGTATGFNVTPQEIGWWPDLLC